MSIRAQIVIRGINIDVIRKDIKNLHIGVYPPNGRVRVAAPLRLDDDAVRLAVISRVGWIHRQRFRFEQQERQSEREMVSGESHYVRGRRYRLLVVEASMDRSVQLRPNKVLELRVHPGASQCHKQAVLDRWYRQLMRQQLAELIEKWEPIIGVRVSECRIKKMKTRWGTCNEQARRIWLNLELAKKPQACLEYILVHEMIHLLERRHTERFAEYMNKFLPGWRHRRAELNRAPLAHERWTY